MSFTRSGGKRKAKAKKAHSGTRSGSLMKPVDVRSAGDIPNLEKLLKKGPLTIVLIYADWCGACQRFKGTPEWNRALKTNNRTMNIGSVREDILPQTSLANAKIEHYPSLLLVGNDGKSAEFKTPEGEITNALPPTANSNIDKIVETPIPPEITTATADEVVDNAISAPPPTAPPATPPVTPPTAVKENTVPSNNTNWTQDLQIDNTNWTQDLQIDNTNKIKNTNMILPEAPDLADTIASVKSASQQPAKPAIVGGGRRGGLYHALLRVVGKKTRRYRKRRAAAAHKKKHTRKTAH